MTRSRAFTSVQTPGGDGGREDRHVTVPSEDLRLYCCSNAAGRKILNTRVIRSVPRLHPSGAARPLQPGPFSGGVGEVGVGGYTDE